MTTKLSLLLSTFLFLSISLTAQVTIWQEDFNAYPDATTDAPGLWNTMATDCDDPGINMGNMWGVFGGVFTVNEVEGAPCCVPDGGGNDNNWQTEDIDISAYCTVQFSLNTGSSGDLECLSPGVPLWACTGMPATDDFHDQMVIEFDVDGATTQAAYICGDNGVGPINVTGITGNTLVIRIFAANKFGSETYTFDDILVEGFLPTAVPLSLSQTNFCETDNPFALPPIQNGVPGTWSGPGVSGGTFDPGVGAGPWVLTFTPDPGECALPNTIMVTVSPAPSANPASDSDCANVAGLVDFDLTSLEPTINGGTGNPVSWYFDINANFPISNPGSFVTNVNTTIYAVVTVGGCASFPVPVDLTVDVCDIATPNLSCHPTLDQNECWLCEDGILPGELGTLFIDFPDLPPGGYDIELTYGSTQNGFQTMTVNNYMGGPLNFSITDTTVFFITQVACPNTCIDLTGLGDQVAIYLVNQPILDGLPDQTVCDSYTLPPITGSNIPGDAAYYTGPDGTGTMYMPGEVITSSQTLFIYAAAGTCSDETSFDITLGGGFDPGWTAPAGICEEDGAIVLSPDGDLGGAWTGIGVTDNGDGTASFDPSIVGAGSVTYGGGSPPCDSSLTQFIEVFPLVDTTQINLATCNSNEVGSDTTQLMSFNGCDSIVIITTVLIPFADTTMLVATSCDPMAVGMDTLLLQNQSGCDSVVITTTTLLPSDTTFQTATSCDPMAIGMDTVFLQNQLGCDSLIITTTSLAPADTTFQMAESCDPMSVGMDTLTLQNQLGCDSLIITTTSLIPPDTTFLMDVSCDTMDIGMDTVTLQNQIGCDSLVITTTTLAANDTTLVFEMSCNPLDTGVVVDIVMGTDCETVVITTTTLSPSDTLVINDTTCDPNLAGIDTMFLQNQFGCDSLVISNITLLPSDTILLQEETCDPNAVGSDTLFLMNQFGCDSLVIFESTLLGSDTVFIVGNTCDPAMVGLDTSLLVNQAGCDSVVITDILLQFPDTTILMQSTCDPAMVGTDTVFLQNVFGCDSLVITDIGLLPSDTLMEMAFSCDPAMVGIDTAFLQNQFGCDSLVITDTQLLPSDTTFLTDSSCDPNNVGLDTLSLSNQFGCDSLVITETFLSDTDTIFVNDSTCDPALAGIDTVFLQNQSGCDSLIITDTQLLPSDLINIMETTCDPMQAGIDTMFLQNQFGCDSLVITDTQLLPSDELLIQNNTCDPMQAGIDTMFLQNQFGCDSLVITETILDPSDLLFFDAATCDPAMVGIDTAFLQNQFGCDSLIVTNTVLIPPSMGSFTETICPGDSIQVNGTFYSESNPTGTDTLIASTGCDSILDISISFFADAASLDLMESLCPGESIDVGGITFDVSNPSGSVILPSSVTGCDSLIVNVTLDFLELNTTFDVEDATCIDENGYLIINAIEGAEPPYSYSLNGAGFIPVGDFPFTVGPLDPGFYNLEIESLEGCLVEESFGIDPAPIVTLDLGIDPVVESGESVTIVPIVNFDIASLLWTSTGSIPCDTCLVLEFTPTESMTIAVVGTDVTGCVATDEIFLQVVSNTNTFTPNVFSPNFDGINDYFTLYVNPKQNPEIKTMQIYSRWGELLFVKEGFAPNDPQEGWDGTFRNRQMNPGVYVFYAELEYPDGTIKVVKGDITLVR